MSDWVREDLLLHPETSLGAHSLQVIHGRVLDGVLLKQDPLLPCEKPLANAEHLLTTAASAPPLVKVLSWFTNSARPAVSYVIQVGAVTVDLGWMRKQRRKRKGS